MNSFGSHIVIRKDRLWVRVIPKRSALAAVLCNILWHPLNNLTNVKLNADNNRVVGK